MHCDMQESGLYPIINAKCIYIILGSMPSVASLSAGEYYAHPQNRFWKIMFMLLEEKNTVPDYDEKIKMVLNHNIAIWDMIESCEREGSLDSAIKNEQENDILNLLRKFPNIKTIFFNGNKAYTVFKRKYKSLLNNTSLNFISLPSTSPANAKFRLNDLLKIWGEAFKSAGVLSHDLMI